MTADVSPVISTADTEPGLRTVIEQGKKILEQFREREKRHVEGPWIPEAQEEPEYLEGAQSPKCLEAVQAPTTFKVFSSDDLLTRDWPEPIWIVPDLLPIGLTLLAGRPKVGKSWLALQLCGAVSSGGRFLGQEVDKARILYMALEDSKRRVAERMKKQCWHIGQSADFMTIGEAKGIIPFAKGSADALARTIEESGYRLVVIDTLGRAVTGDQNAADVMTAALTPLQEMAHSCNCAVVLVDHHNKMGAASPYGGGPGLDVSADPVLNILGSTAKAAMADCIWGLYKSSQGKAGAVLAITGRDLEEKQLTLKQDGLTRIWQCEGNADQVRMTDTRRAVFDAVKELGRATCQDLAKAVGRNKGNVYRDLTQMVDSGVLCKAGDIYSLLGEESERENTK